ncbi:MAG: hypothetical protein K1X64_06570 [Myxococcaceae bacterium]|nr:hypothetical protein [Myxococcaceae bacterium]
MTAAFGIEQLRALLGQVKQQLEAKDAVAAAETADQAVALCAHSADNQARLEAQVAHELLELHRGCLEAALQLQAQLKGSVTQTGLSRRAMGAYGQETAQAPFESEGP